MIRILSPVFLLVACSFASANDVPDLHDDHPGLALEEPSEPGPIAYDIGEPLFADVRSSVVRAQLDAEAMLDDVRAAHDAEAALVLRERER